MNIDKKALGRGLSALISDNPAMSYDNSNDSAPQFLLINSIIPNPYQPRKEFKEEELNELANSIKEYGVLQPILVCKRNDHYQIIAGERRWHASKIVGLNEVPAIVKNYNDSEMFEVALIENIQRENLNAIEEAAAYKRLLDDFKMTQDQISYKVGKSRSYIANTLRLLNLPEDVKNMIIGGRLSAGHARNLVGKDNALEIAHMVLNDNLSVRDVEKLTKDRHLSNTYPSPNTQTNGDLAEVETSLSESLGMTVTIKDDHKGGKVTIHFSTLAQLDQLIQLLGNKGLSF